MICIAAAIVFGILAIFSAKYRTLAKEAWDCVFRKMTLRPCQSGLDRRMRMGAMLAVSKRSPAAARLIYKMFPAISVIFVLATIVSFAYLAWGGYNFALYGNCNGPGSTGFCVFDPNGVGSSDTGQCTEGAQSPEMLVRPNDGNLTVFKVINPEGTKTVVFFGCYACKYTREAAPALMSAMSVRPQVRFVLIDFPLAQHANSTLAATAGNCAYDVSPAAYLEYVPAVYSTDLTYGIPAPSANINSTEFAACTASEHPRVALGRALGIQSGIYGTPTYFIGGEAYVGPLNKRALLKLIDDAES